MKQTAKQKRQLAAIRGTYAKKPGAKKTPQQIAEWRSTTRSREDAAVERERQRLASLPVPKP